MMRSHPSRLRFIAEGAVLTASLAAAFRPAKAAQFEFKCGSNFTADHSSSVRLRQMWTEVEQLTGGRIKTAFYPNSVLGSEPAMIPQVRLGATQFYVSGLGNLTASIPAANIFFLGLAFKDDTDGLNCVDGPLGDYVRKDFAAQNLYPVKTVMASGMLQLTSSVKPIHTPADLKGLKIRVANGRMSTDLFKYIGANPVSVSTNEVYTALQTRLIDGTSSPLPLIETGRFFEAQKYVSLTNHQCGSLWLMANGDVWKSLPPDLQAIIEKSTTKYALLQRRDTILQSVSLIDKLSRQGMTVNRVDLTPFRPLLHEYYEYWNGQFGPAAWGLLETAIGRKLG